MSILVSILQGGANNHQTTSEEANFYATDFLAEGIVGLYTNTSGVSPATGAFAVNAQGSPNMTVAVSTGVAWVDGTPTGGSSQKLRVRNTASSNVTISANSSGSTKYDWVYIKIDPDKAKDPNSAASDVGTLVTSRSTSQTVDDGTPPTYGYPLAVVTVANSAPSIANSSIKDIRTLADGDARSAYVSGDGTTSSTTYADASDTSSLDSVTVNIGPSGIAEVFLYARMSNTTTNAFSFVSFVASGANTISAVDEYSLKFQQYTGNAETNFGAPFLLTGLAPGSTTFKMKYKVASGGNGAGTAGFNKRRIAVVPR